MSVKILLMFTITTLLFTSLSSADATFTNEIQVSDSSIEFTINEFYDGADAESFWMDLDYDNNSVVDPAEVQTFVQGFKAKGSMRYLGYILVDDGRTNMSMESFDLVVSGAQGNASPSEITVRTNMVFDIDGSLSSGRHSIWILGHPSIEKMTISLPADMLIVSVDGIDDLQRSSCGSDNQLLEGRSGIRSFISDGRQVFEYAVLIETGKSRFIADLSRFPSFF